MGEIGGTWWWANLELIFRLRVPLFQSHKMFSPNGEHSVVLENMSERRRDVVEYRRMLQVGLDLG